MTGDAVVLDGDRHESVLLEKGGRFQEVCGCGWRSTWTTDPSASREHSEHVAGENLWARLTGAQRAAIDVLVTLPPGEWVRGATTAKSAVRGIMAVSTRVNTRTALWLAGRGYVEPEWMGAYRFRLTSRGPGDPSTVALLGRSRRAGVRVLPQLLPAPLVPGSDVVRSLRTIGCRRMTIMRIRPIERWPKEQTPPGERKPSPFLRPNQPREDGRGYTGRREVPYSQTELDLDRELAALGVDEAVLQLAVRERDLRIDGSLRADARPAGPGVILTFTAPGKGPLTFACDAFDKWQTNLRAIAKGLEALRLVDRYGITSRGEQYAGWKEIGSGVPLGERPDALAAMSVEEAARTVVGWVSGTHDLERNARTAIEDLDFRRFAHRQAVKHLHPDAGGPGGDAFLRLEAAMKVLEANDA